MNLHRTPNKPDGFTLIELLVVLAILGMLAALVGPAIFSNLGKGQRATAAAAVRGCSLPARTAPGMARLPRK